MMKSFSKKFMVAGATISALAMLLAGCGGGTANQAEGAAEPASGFEADYQGTYPMPAKDKAYNNPQKRDAIADGGTLNLATTYTPNWNYWSVDGGTGYMASLWSWYQPAMAHLDVKGNFSWNPDYITKSEITSKDPLTITYDINEKAVWNDGTPIDYRSFKATWQVLNGKNEAYNPSSSEGYNKIASVEKGTSDKQAVVTFAEPYYPWQSIFTSLVHPDSTDPTMFTQGWIDNPHNEWAAGPYKVEKADKDQVVFVPNEKWWGDKPKLDKIVYKYMESTAELNAFKNGELDSVEFSTNTSLQTIKSRKDMQIRLGYSSKVNVFTFNGQSETLKDINVRRALVMGFDRKTIENVHFQGLNWHPEAPGSEVFPVYQEGYENNVPKEAQSLNVEGAKKSLEESGYKMGSDGYYEKDGKILEVRFTYFGASPTITAIAKAFQQMMKTVGIKLNMDNRDESKFSETMTKHDYEIVPMAWQSSSPYGQNNMVQLYGSKSDSNYTLIGSDEIDKLAAIPGTIEDQNEAVKAANKAEKAALALFGTMVMDNPPQFYAVKKGLANWGPAGFATTRPEDVGFQK